MPMVDKEFEEAKKIVEKSSAVDDFRKQVEASTLRWWNADTKQKQALTKTVTDSTSIAEANKNAIKAWIEAYCGKVGWKNASDYIGKAIGSTGESGRGHWLIYYLQECTMAGEKLTEEGRKLVDEALNELLCRTVRADSKSPDKLIVRPNELAVKGGSIDAIAADKFRSILTRLLNAGFVRFPGSPEQFKAKDTSHPDLLQYLYVEESKKNYRYGWRSDSRSHDEIVTAKGFLSKAQTEGYAKTHGMRDAWHPYADADTRSYMRFRNGQNDNCLYSVVSIGEPGGDWQGYLSFPLLKDHKAWAVTDKELPCLVNNVSTKGTFGVSFTWLYLYVMDDLLIAKTNAIQTAMGEGKFPELGAPGIPLANLYGAIKFVRLHHAPKDDATDDQGFSAKPVDFVTRAASSVVKTWGPTEYNKIDALFKTVANKAQPPIHIRWTPSGYEPVSETFDVANKQVKFTHRSYEAAG